MIKTLKFGIDLDGVLADFTSAVIIVANSLWPGKIPEGYTPDVWNYEGVLTADEWKQVWKELMRTKNLWLNLPSLPGVADLQKFLTEFSCNVYFITSRCDTKGFSALEQCTSWLKNRGIQGTVIPVDKPSLKLKLLKDHNIRFFLDDHAPTVQDMFDNGINAYLLDAPYNRYAENLPRVYSVAGYLEIVKNTETLNA